MLAKTLMVQGTASGVGKSMLVTALCRILKQDGYRVAPFKSQNMALNSFVTKRGEEMGRAQVVQAEAACLEPDVDMNPILLKPEAGSRCQVVVMGKPAMTLSSGEYGRHADELLAIVEKSLARLRSAYDIVVIEGAGSPAEININKNTEIVNMRIARLAQAPVLLVGDIDKGGVFASLVGTLALLDETERACIKGLVINKFRGDVRLLQDGLDYLEKYTGKPVLGVIPYYHGILIPEEDSIYSFGNTSGKEASTVTIAVIHLPHLSNSPDFEPLQQESGVNVNYVDSMNELRHPDAVILPGSKSTVADLAYLWQSGLASEIIKLAKNGTPLFGICGGFQMLGREISDPDRVESGQSRVNGLGLLDVTTVFERQKTTRQVKAQVLCNVGLLEGLKGEEVTGYEIHMGQTSSNGTKPLFLIRNGQEDHNDGAMDDGGLVFGSYLHGLFDNANFRRNFISRLRQRKGLSVNQGRPLPSHQEQYDKLAEIVRNSLNMPLVYKICGVKHD